MKKSLYLITGFVFLIVAVIGLSIYGELFETKIIQNDIPKTESEPKKQMESTEIHEDHSSINATKQNCASSDAKSNLYIQEFEITTPCTQPLSISTDSDGNIWVFQTNSGNLDMFDPRSEEFIEYQNDKWDLDRVSMSWGMSYTQDKEIWFTDGATGSLWKFSIPEKIYSQFKIPTNAKTSFPQKIELVDDYFLINDFLGNQVVTINHGDLDKEKITYESISVPEGYFASQASMDEDGNIWFVMWKFKVESTLVKANSITQEIEYFPLPYSVSAPNGVSVGPSGNVWIADTASSSFYRFNPDDAKVMEFVTSDPPIWAFGNYSGKIKNPITRPYWTDFDSKGNLWFNEQTANRLAVFDPKTESLIEYDIPSKNPNWADCGDLNDCGVSQNFGFTIKDKQVWFTEWAENKIGVLDTSIPLPAVISIDKDEIEIKQGQQKEILVTVTPKTNQKSIVLSGNTNSESITIKTKSETTIISDKPVKIPITVTVDKDADKGHYKILIGSQFSDVVISTYATIYVK